MIAAKSEVNEFMEEIKEKQWENYKNNTIERNCDFKWKNKYLNICIQYEASVF